MDLRLINVYDGLSQVLHFRLYKHYINYMSGVDFTTRLYESNKKDKPHA